MKKESFIRYWILGGLLLTAGLLIFGWIIRIQTGQTAETFRKLGESYKSHQVTLYPERGNIYDRWGRLLAGNIETYEVALDVRSVSDPETIASTLSGVLGLDYNEVLNIAKTVPTDADPKYYFTVADFVTSDKIEALKAEKKRLAEQAKTLRVRKGEVAPNITGVITTPHLKRSYPEHTVAANILGFYSFGEKEAGTGYFGVEEKYNQLLSGTPITVDEPTDPYLIRDVPQVKPGASLVLTIDRDIQAMTERIADKAMNDTGAQSATILVMDPKTGEILAMAATPRIDPNEYWKSLGLFTAGTSYNRAIGVTYEPGSVFKVLTMASALDAKVVEPATPFLDTGAIMVGGVPIYNWDRGAWGPQDMLGCMQHSLNVCLAWVATELGPTRFYEYMNNFGIGHMTGIDLAGEVSSPMVMHGDTDWYPVNLGTNSFGQGIAASPIQMVTAISAVANHGKMMAPHVLKSVIEDGEEFENPPQVIGSPISADTAHTLSEMLAQSLEGESSDALVEGYRVSGKTGTAEIPGPGGYLNNVTNASFVGWGPTDDPRFLVYVWLEKPSSSIWGSVVAAPVFSEVVKNLVVLMDIPPDDVRQTLIGYTP